jgi:acid phosphatase family membrane protein YuiD
MIGSYYPIVAALAANIFAQIVKVPIHLILYKEWKPGLAISTGGMPSSHSSTVAAMTTAVGFIDGFDSTTFAIALTLTIVVAYDAQGVRRHAGTHAEAINNLYEDLRELMNTIVHHPLSNEKYNKQFKELLGHQPLEVFFGLLTGVFVAIMLIPYV